MVDREQARMKQAVSFITEAESLGEQQGKYRTRVLAAPVFIHDTGLLQALAFLISKKDEKAFQLFASHLLRWILRGSLSDALPAVQQEARANDNWQKFSQLSELSSDQILLHTQETLALLQWLKRFAEARLKEEKS